MNNQPCPRCGNKNPAEIHTCTPLALKLADELLDGMNAQRTPASTAAKAQYKCASCGSLFLARVADRKRGWARFCSKSCKAVKQEQRTGQHKAYLSARDGELCFPSHAEGDIQ